MVILGVPIAALILGGGTIDTDHHKSTDPTAAQSKDNPK